MKSFTKTLVPVAALVTIAITSCSKLVNEPIPLPNIQSFEQFPFEAYLDSLAKLPNPPYYFFVWATPPNYEIPSQKMVSAYAFRSSTPGAVTSLAILEPAAGYAHTIELWDSASGQLLTEANITTVDSGRWASVSLALNGQEVLIQANHGYVVGFNSLAVGHTPDQNTNGELVYLETWESDQAGFLPSPILPFTRNSITFEGESEYLYNPTDVILLSPPFNDFYGGGGTIIGTCDIGFIPEPQ
jgi:hypothetical protein